MFRRRNDPQKVLIESFLPPGICQLPEELKKVDTLLNDEKFFTPFQEKFSRNFGRPTIPMETYLRMMYLKHRYQLGYETLTKEVNDSITWRIFCKIPFNQLAPDSTTLIKLTRKIGDDAVKVLNELLIKKARTEKIIRGKKLRIDSTVMEANIHYPTDASLLGDSVRVITRVVKKIKEKGSACGVFFRDKMRTVKKSLASLGRVLKRSSKESKDKIKKITSSLVTVAEEVVERGSNIVRSLKKKAGIVGGSLRQSIESQVKDLSGKLDLAKKVIVQTKEVLSGNLHLKERIVSIFETSARPIVTGKVKEKVQFGWKVVLGGIEKGFIGFYKVLEGNPSDEGQLLPVVEAHIESFGVPPEAVTTDKGFSSRDNEQKLEDLGVKKIAQPVRGRRSEERRKYEKQGWFRRLYRWRAGIEGKISVLKRKYGLDLSLYRGTEGAGIQSGWGILVHNLLNWARAG